MNSNKLYQWSKHFFIVLIILFLPLLSPKKSYSEQKPSLAIQANRCRYYYIRSRSGDSSARFLLMTKDNETNGLSGLEKCIKVIDDYLKETTVTTQQREVYENVRHNMSFFVEKQSSE
jgi:hypothetical protein